MRGMLQDMAALHLERGEAHQPCTSPGCPGATEHTAVENTSAAPHSIDCSSSPRKTQMGRCPGLRQNLEEHPN